MCVVTAAMAGTATMATMANVSLAITAIGAAMQGVSMFQQGQSESAMAKYRASLYDRDAKVANMQAEDALKRGEIEKGQLRDRISMLKGEGQAAYGSSGVVLGEGSPLDWAMDVAEQGAIDEDMIDYNARMEAWGFRNQAAGYSGQAGMSRAAASSASSSGIIGAGASIIGGVGSVSEKYYKFSN